MTNHERLIKELSEDIYLQLGPSPLHGIGVFAIKKIPKLSHPFEPGIHNYQHLNRK